MKFFIDSANVKEIREANDLGVIDGVTTNPSLVAKEGRNLKEVIQEICSIVDGPISAEVVSLDSEEMVKEGRGLAKIHPNVVVKIPMTPDGLKAIKKLSQDGIAVNVTLIFSPIQALLAAKAGAAYVSPFVGRLDDIGHVGMDLIQQIVTIFNNYVYRTEVLVASVRNPVHIIDAAMMGAHVATIPYQVIMQLTKHPLTDSGLKKFLTDWEKNPQKQ
ncbi:MAG: fructose-6-phosphate aldolase [Nitrospirae bacterium]|nr:fructose-6-phosphate aldolase [Nitrospirota bacterium]MBI3352509.1 fructose-6-phosphate aldolase [Nitrospirota bacterium]